VVAVLVCALALGTQLSFAVTRFLMKLFRSTNIDVIDECRLFFNFMLLGEKLEKLIISCYLAKKIEKLSPVSIFLSTTFVVK